MDVYERKATIINRKFFEFLAPTVLSIVAISLNEFVDGIIVSNLLGHEAMTLINMAFPIMLIFAMIHTFLGVGGSIIYAENAGKQDADSARKTFSVTMMVSVLFSLLILQIGSMISTDITSALGVPAEYYDVFVRYIRILFISGVFIIPVQTFISFTPALGFPKVGTFINVSANVINLLMDYIFIKFFDTDVAGASMATLAGYIAGLIIIVAAVMLKKVDFPFVFARFREFRRVPGIIMRGLAPSITQLGYCIKIGYCNILAMLLGAFAGVSIFALCIQAVSIASIAIGGIIGAMVPIAASLYGQRDYNGIKLLLNKVLVVQLVANLGLLVLFEGFPQLLLALYNVDGIPIEEAKLAIRIFSIMFVFRGFSVVYTYYFQIIGRKWYANIVSAIDGFIGIIPVSLILGNFLGLDGLWLAFPAVALLLDIGIIIVNSIIAARSKGRYRNFMLYEEESRDVPVYDVTYRASDEEIIENELNFESFCKKNNLGASVTMFAEIVSEEMSELIKDNVSIKKADQIDMLVKIYPDHLLFDFRSVGKPFDVASEVSRGSNLDVLKKLSYSADFSYVMGMNLTRIKLIR